MMTRRNSTLKGILDDVVIVKTHLTTFVVTSGMYTKAFRSVSFVAKNTATVVIDDVDLSSDASLTTDSTYCIRYLMKKYILSCGRGKKKYVAQI